MRYAALALILAAATTVSASQATQAAKPIDYDTYCKLPDAESKRTAFFETTAENRGTLVRTQLERWRDANQACLDDKQKAALAALIKSITAESYINGPQGEPARLKSREIATEVATLFTRDEVMAMQPNAPCIAKK